MRDLLPALLVSSLLACAVHATSASTVESVGLAPSLPEEVSALVDELGLSGVVLVSRGGEALLTKAFNVAPLADDYEITVNSAFAIASLTKSFTAALVLDQVNAGRIALDQPVSFYLPTFDASYADAVTVRHLLQHRSGIPHYVDIPGWFDPEVKGAFTAESFPAQMAALELKFPPGADYYYSNVNYYLLGLILEAATEQSYEGLLKARVLQPMGLECTGQIYSVGKTALAPTYLRDGAGYERIRITNPSLFRATASQYSTASDLAAFLDGLLSGTLLDQKMLDVLLDEEQPMGFTVGFVPMSGKPVKVVTYNGELAGTTTIMAAFPERSATVVILSNNNITYAAVAQLVRDVAELALRE